MDNFPLIILGGMIGLVAAVIIIKQPYVGVVITVISAPVIDLIPPIPYFPSALPLVGAVTLVGYLLKIRGAGGKLKIKFDSEHLLGLLFIIWVFVSNPQAAWSGTDRNWIFTFVQLLVLMVMAGGLIEAPKQHQVMMSLFAAVSVISAFTAISQGYIGEDIAASARVSGFAAGANDAARYFVVAMVFLTYLRSKTQDALLRLLLLASIVVTYIGVFFTVSRTGIILLFIAQLLILIFQRQGKQRIQMLVIFGIAFTVMLILSDAILEIISSILPSITHGTDTIGLRYQLWRAGWKMWLDHPVSGVGIGMFFHNSYQYMSQIPGVSPRALVAHNMYVQILAETGIVGFILFMSILVRSMRNFWVTAHLPDPEQTKLRDVWLIVFLVMLIGGITKTDHIDKLLWMVMGLSVRFAQLMQAPRDEKVPDAGIPVTGSEG